MFIIRAAFWLGLVIALIPVNSVDLPQGERAVSTLETIGLAKSVVGDVASFCNRNEQTCDTGSLLISQMGAKAREAAKIAYTWLDGRYGPDNTMTAEGTVTGRAAVDPVETGSLAD
jgi:hypothetical protein